MTKRCLYCKSELSDSSVVDFCKKCGIGVWGERMFNAIIQSMEEAKERGNLSLNDPGNIFKESEKILKF